MIDNSKTVGIFHNDLDGCVSYILLSKVFKIDKVKYAYSYAKIDEIIDEVCDDDYNLCLIADISMTPEQYIKLQTKFGEQMLYVDHHITTKPTYKNRANEIFIFDTEYSASGIIYQKILKNKTEPLHKLSIYADCYDMWRHKEFNNAFLMGYKLNVIFNEYKFNKFANRFKDGFDSFTPNEEMIIEETFMRRKKLMAQSVIETISDTSLVFIPAGYEIINDISLVFSDKRVYYIIYRKDDKYKLSLRGNNVSFVSIYEKYKDDKSVINIGGHPTAGAIMFNEHIELDDIFDLIENLENEVIYE